jgi:hypothetical protein
MFWEFARMDISAKTNKNYSVFSRLNKCSYTLKNIITELDQYDNVMNNSKYY